MNTARSLVCLSVALLPTVALAGPDWVEVEDAGGTVSSAQPLLGVGTLRTVSGGLSAGFLGSDFEDMYLIRITDPAEFRFSIVSADFDAALWLFNVTRAGEGFGLLGNLDEDFENSTPALTHLATDGTGASVNQPGVYALAISGNGWRPTSARGNIFGFELRNEISGADGGGGLLPHTGWAGTGSGGHYTIDIQGATFVDVPAPGVLMAGVASLMGVGLRRRR